MKLKLNSFKNDGGERPSEGVYINEVTIKKIEILDNPFPNSEYPKPDLAIGVEFDIDRNFFPNDIIAGNFKRDDVSGEVIGFGSAFKVADFFAKALDNTQIELEEDHSIPTGWLTDAVGKKVLRLTYAYAPGENGKLKYKHWNRYGNIAKSSDILYKGFVASVEKGYTKDFLQPTNNTANYKDMFPDEKEDNKPLII